MPFARFFPAAWPRSVDDALDFALVVGNLALNHLARFGDERPVVVPLAHALNRERNQDTRSDRDQLNDEVFERVSGRVRRMYLHGHSLLGGRIRGVTGRTRQVFGIRCHG